MISFIFEKLVLITLWFLFKLIYSIYDYVYFAIRYFLVKYFLIIVQKIPIVSVTDMRGNVISWSSSGACGFKGSRKSTPFAAQTTTEIAVKKALDQGIRQIEINVSGPGSGRDTAIRAIQNLGLGILMIRDVTRIPHNGCRPTKKRRI